MGKKYKAQNNVIKGELSDVYAFNMAKYNQHKDYIKDYSANSVSFVGENARRNIPKKSYRDRHLESYAEFKHSDQPVTYRSLKPAVEFSNVKNLLNKEQVPRFTNEDSTMILSKNNQLNSEIIYNSKDFQYFTKSGSSDAAPEAFLFSPSVRDDTDFGVYDNFPCSNGVKGSAEHHHPGDKIIVKWQVLNPVDDSKCAIKLAQSNDQNSSSYKKLIPFGKSDLDQSTGYFKCGSGDPESAIIQIPSDTDCISCTLQFVYKAPDFGESYQCADITTQEVKSSDD